MSTILPSVSSTKSGVLSTGTQTVAGDKSFTGNVTFSGTVAGVTATTSNVEINYVAFPSSIGTGGGQWTKTGTTGAGTNSPTTTSTAGDLPLGGVISTAIQMVTGASNGAEASHYTSCTFTTSASGSVKMKVEFHMRPGTNFASNEWTVSIYQGSTRQTLSTDSSGVTYLPNATGKFTTSFDAVASTAYTLRFARVSGTTAATLNVANVIVGTGIQPQGAVIGKEISYTPTIGNVTTSTATARYVQIGTNARITAFFTTSAAATGVMTVSLPTGLTIDTTALPSSTQGEQAVGSYRGIKASGSPFNDTGTVIYYTTTTVAMQSKDRGTPNDSDDPWASASGDKFSLTFTVPIAEWAGSGTVNLAQNDVEYAADNGTNDVFGPDGALVPNVSASIDTTVRDFTFQSPQQATGDLVIEYNGGSGWARASDIFPFTSGNNGATNNFYGIRGYWNSSTVFRVEFGNQGTRVDASNVSAGHQSWASRNAAGAKWRVRKSSAGAAVGFGLADTLGNAGLVNPYSSSGAGVVYAGTWTGTTTNGTNTSASSFIAGSYIRVGNQVQVSFQLSITNTTAAGTLSLVELSLPIASNLTSANDLNGTGIKNNATPSHAIIYGSAANDRAVIQFNCQTASAESIFGQFMYTIK